MLFFLFCQPAKAGVGSASKGPATKKTPQRTDNQVEDGPANKDADPSPESESTSDTDERSKKASSSDTDTDEGRAGADDESASSPKAETNAAAEPDANDSSNTEQY